MLSKVCNEVTWSQSTHDKEGPATRFLLDPAVMAEEVTVLLPSLQITSWRSPAFQVSKELLEAQDGVQGSQFDRTHHQTCFEATWGAVQ